jgi:restriction system protein
MADGHMTFLQAAEDVLRRHSPGAPLHFRRITALALEDGLVESQGLTPDATMGAQLYSDVKRRAAAGKPERFRQYGKGLFGLATPADPLGGAILEHNGKVRARLRSVLAEMNPEGFEHLIALLLGTLGFEDVGVTKYSGDGGIDVRATLTVGGVTDVKTAVQVKRWANNVSGRTVRELRGGLGPHERGLIITLSDFTSDARLEAAASDRTPITLVNGDELLALLVENDIGVATRTMSILELDESSLLPVEAETPEGADSPTIKIAGVNKYKGSKALSMWPLPGGRNAWKSALEKILRYIAETAPSVDQATNWVIANFEKVSSPKVARGYLNSVFRPLDLIETQGELIVLTTTGVSYLDDPTSDALLAIARRNVAGFDEVLEALAAGPQSSGELLTVLQEKLGVSWETDAQVRFRLGWLENMGKVVETHGQWSLIAEAHT